MADRLKMDSSLVIEIGTGDGASAWKFAQCPGAIVQTFEPSTAMRSKAFERLRDLRNVTLMPYAIGGDDRQATLYQCNGAGASLHNTGGARECCTVVSMNHWMVYARVAEVDLLFLDCNGSEYEILEQMIECDRLQQVRRLLIAWDDNDLKRKALIRDELNKTHQLVCGSIQQWIRRDNV